MTGHVQKIIRGFDRENISYELSGDHDEIICMNYRMNSNNMVKTVIFTNVTEGDGHINIVIGNIASFTETSTELFRKINEINAQYRWYKVYMDVEHHTILMSADAIIDCDNPLLETMELIMRGFSIADEIYPELMKIIWR